MTDAHLSSFPLNPTTRHPKSVLLAVMLAAAAFSAVFVAAPADAGLRHFHGKVGGGGTVDFDVLVKRGKPVKVGNFDLARIPVSCKPSDTRVNFSTNRVVPVRNREFAYDFRGFWAWIVGRFKPSGEFVAGNLSYGVNDLDSTGRSECTTDGPRRWRASL